MFIHQPTTNMSSSSDYLDLPHPLIGTSNYSTWAPATKSRLQRQGLWSHVDGSATSPKGPVLQTLFATDTSMETVAGKEEREKAECEAKNWKEAEDKVKLMLQKSVSGHVLGNIVHLGTTRDMWMRLEILYGPKGNEIGGVNSVYGVSFFKR